MPRIVPNHMSDAFITQRQQLITLLDTYRKSKSATDKEIYLMALFHFQYKYNTVYKYYCDNLHVNASKITFSKDIPHLPISAFKHHEVKTYDFIPEDVFMSSGTTGSLRSKHLVKSLDFYRNNTVEIWSQYFNPVQEYCYFALLPGYLERDGSSLIRMVQHFINLSNYKQSGFFLRDHDALADHLLKARAQKNPVVLFGVTYALLDFVADFPMRFPELIVMETGGMKGQRKEVSKTELHEILKNGLGTVNIFSEYGMTELFSQAYSKGGTRFLPNYMIDIHTRQINDPLVRESFKKSGIITVTDLANIDSCAFIQTEDQGVSYENGTFEIIGRLTNSDIRGCNLLLEEFSP